MFSRSLLVNFTLFVCAASLSAQSTPLPTRVSAPVNSSTNTSAPVATKPRDPVEMELQQALRERDAIIRNLLDRVADLERKVGGAPTLAAASRIEPGPAALATTGAATPVSPSSSVVTNQGYDAEERQATQALDQALVMRGGLLLPPGTLEVENTVNYFNASSSTVSIDGFAILPILVVGDITSERVRRDILLSSFSTRLGVSKNFQFEVAVPYGYDLNRTVSVDGKHTSAHSFGLGDVQLAVSRQFGYERGRRPDLLGSLRFKTTTGSDSFDLGSAQTALGTGFYALQGNLTAVKTSDPLVFFGNLSYTKNFSGSHTIPANDPNNPGATMLGHFNPGSSVGFALGSVLAINPETSMTFGWDQRFTRATKLNGQSIPASYLAEGTLRIGTQYLYAPGKTVDLGFGIGLTPDVPGMQFSIGFPFRFPLWKPGSSPAVH